VLHDGLVTPACLIPELLDLVLGDGRLRVGDEVVVNPTFTTDLGRGVEPDLDGLEQCEEGAADRLVLVGRDVGENLQNADVDVRLGGQRADAKFDDSGFLESPVLPACQATTVIPALTTLDGVSEPADLPR
jgi:hypothetical protein